MAPLSTSQVIDLSLSDDEEEEDSSVHPPRLARTPGLLSRSGVSYPSPNARVPKNGSQNGKKPSFHESSDGKDSIRNGPSVIPSDRKANDSPGHMSHASSEAQGSSDTRAFQLFKPYHALKHSEPSARPQARDCSRTTRIGGEREVINIDDDYDDNHGTGRFASRTQFTGCCVPAPHDRASIPIGQGSVKVGRGLILKSPDNTDPEVEHTSRKRKFGSHQQLSATPTSSFERVANSERGVRRLPRISDVRAGGELAIDLTEGEDDGSVTIERKAKSEIMQLQGAVDQMIDRLPNPSELSKGPTRSSNGDTPLLARRETQRDSASVQKRSEPRQGAFQVAAGDGSFLASKGSKPESRSSAPLSRAVTPAREGGGFVSRSTTVNPVDAERRLEVPESPIGSLGNSEDEAATERRPKRAKLDYRNSQNKAATSGAPAPCVEKPIWGVGKALSFIVNSKSQWRSDLRSRSVEESRTRLSERRQSKSPNRFTDEPAQADEVLERAFSRAGIDGSQEPERPEIESQPKSRQSPASPLPIPSPRGPANLDQLGTRRVSDPDKRAFLPSPSATSEENPQPKCKSPKTDAPRQADLQVNEIAAEPVEELAEVPAKDLLTSTDVVGPSKIRGSSLDVDQSLPRNESVRSRFKDIARDALESTAHGNGENQAATTDVRSIAREARKKNAAELDSIIPATEQPSKMNERSKIGTGPLPQKGANKRSAKHVATEPNDQHAMMTPDSTLFQQQTLHAIPTLSIAKQTEQVVGRYLEELQADNEHWIRTWLKRARRSINEVTPAPSKTLTDVFKKMQPMALDDKPKKLLTDHARFTTELHVSGKHLKRTYTVPCISYSSTGQDVPNYSHYVSISNNFLAYNETVLQHWPYFGDDFDMRKAEALDQLYFLDVRDREDKLWRLGMAEHLAIYAEDMIKGIGCSWADVFRFLLDPDPDVGSDTHALQALEERDALCDEDFTRTQEPWTKVLTMLPKSEPEKIGKAALLCEYFLNLTKLSLWQVARRSEYAFKLLKESPKIPSMDELTCRICMRFDCPYHGQINEEHASDEEDDGTAGPHVVETDIVHPKNVNHRSRTGFPPTVDARDVSNHSGKDRRALKYWQTGQNAGLDVKPDDRGPFYPCHHPGQSCSDASCSCYNNRTNCEKTCGCSRSCPRKFQGCNCSTRLKRKGQKLVCFEDESCACFQLGRECDADLCGDCGVCEVLDPVYRNDDRILQNRCRNANIQRGIPKHTILGDSGVHGLGLYACETIKEHDFIGEYKGEIITKEEAERRGAVYEHQKLSYLFSLNKHQEIDSTCFGNKVRFINHASKKYNLYPRIIMVNTVHRIALYAAKKIKAGEELFFDYGPKFPHEQLGGKANKNTAQYIRSKAAPHVRNIGLVKEFHDVTEHTDHLGNKRARKVVKHGSGSSQSDESDEAEAMREDTSRPPGGISRTPHSEDDADVEMDDVSDPTPDRGVQGDDSIAEKTWSYDVFKYNIEEDYPAAGHEDDKDPAADDDDFEPGDSASILSEDSEENESQSEEDEEPIQTNKRVRPTNRGL